jgi:hypothetical protein
MSHDVERGSQQQAFAGAAGVDQPRPVEHLLWHLAEDEPGDAPEQ